jgi:hypothetical protein
MGQSEKETMVREFFTCGGALPSGEEEIVFEDGARFEYGTGARVRNYPTKPNASFSTYWGSFSSLSEYASNASFSSMASGWGRVKEGDRSQAMYGARPQMGAPGFAPRRMRPQMEEDEEEEEDQQCSLM